MTIEDLIAINDKLGQELEKMRNEIDYISNINNAKSIFSPKIYEKSLEDRVYNLENKLDKILELLENFLTKYNKDTYRDK
jgi:hypothetical protein